MREEINMSQSDSYFLLRECSAGIKTAVGAIDDVLPYVKEKEFMRVLQKSKNEHKELEKTVNAELEKLGADCKEPNIVAKSMSKVKINAEMSFKPKSAQAASLITDGCGMGIKSINRYLNQYPSASGEVKNIARKLSELEEKLENEMKPYL